MKIADPDKGGPPLPARPSGAVGFLAALALLLACGGCAQVAYDSLQWNQSMSCSQTLGTDDWNDCMRRSDMSYDEYRRELDRERDDR